MVGQDHAQGLDAVAERRFLHGLSCQWEAAAAVLPQRYRRLLRRPFFALHAGGKLWGYWATERYQISISRELVRNHPWDCVCEVLLHEMAHQLADCLATGQPPHGPAFRQACELLGANPRASGTSALLDHRVHHPGDNAADRVIARIRKLLSLAQSPNGFEAEAAMAKAHHLMAKYHVGQIRAAQTTLCESVFAGRPALRIGREGYALAALICDYYFVQGIWVPAFMPDRDRMGRVLEISGSPANLQMAIYAHEFISCYIDTQWKTYAAAHHPGHRCRTDFAVGIIEGFRIKMEQKAAAALNPADLALVRQKDAHVSAHLNCRHPRRRLIRSGRRNWDPEAIAAGQAAGHRLVIHRPVSHSGASTALLPQ